jgi:hypothetical protein
MKQPILLFTAGLATGAAAMWAVQSFQPDESGSGTSGPAVAKLTTEKAALTTRVEELERKLQTTAAMHDKAPDGKPEVSVANIAQHLPSGIDEMMQRQGEADARREADRLALRLKLTPEQRESLHQFLLTSKKKDREAMQAAMKGDASSALNIPRGSSEEKDAFLQAMLRPEQQAEYAKSKDEARTAKAEEHAQRKVRRLTNDLSLTEEQKDKLFQSYAQQKLAEPEGSGSGRAAAFSIGGDVMDLDIDIPGLPGAGSASDKDREMLAGVLTPEQLAVYDQRRAERAEAMKEGSVIHFDSLELGGAAGAVGSISVQVQGSAEEAAPAPAPEK